MMVKVGDAIYSPETIPIMVILTEQDKANIAAHGVKGGMKYCAVPESMKKHEVKKFMEIKIKAVKKP
jgi:hypothetical protein